MKHRLHSLFTRPATAAAGISIGFIALGTSAHAADKYWDTSTATTPGKFQAGNGAWTGTTWDTDVVGNGPLTTFASGDAAFFSARGDSTVTVSGTQNVGAGNGLFIGDIDGTAGATTVIADTSMSLSLSDGTLALAGNMSVRGHRATGFAGSSVLNLSGTNITGNGVDSNLRIQNGGTGASSLTTAAINQSAGTVSMTSMTMGNYGSGASYTITGGNLTLTGAVNMMNSGTTIGPSTINLNGGVFTTSQISANNGTSGARQSNLNFGGGTLKAAADQATFLGGNLNTVTINAGGATIDDGGFAIGINKAIDGVGALTKQGLGTLTLASTHSYAGDTNVTQGTLVINGNISTSSLTTVSSGATLSGTGTVGDATINGTISPGVGGVGTLSFDGGVLTLGSTSKFLFGLGTSSDLISLFNTASLALGTGTLGLADFTFSDSGGFTAGTYTLFSGASSFTGSLDGANLTGTVNGLSSTLSMSGNNLVLTAIPEPTAALLGGLGMLVLLRRRVR